MTRTLTAAMFQKYIEQGFVSCIECDDSVDLSEANDINDAVEIWNDHVQEAHS